MYAIRSYYDLFIRLVAENKLDMVTALPEIHEEKAAALLKEGCLQFIYKTVPVDQVSYNFV